MSLTFLRCKTPKMYTELALYCQYSHIVYGGRRLDGRVTKRGDTLDDCFGKE